MNATKEKIKKGCKQTSIGIIPNDWEVKHFGDVSDIDKESLNSNTPKDYEFDYISLSDIDSDEFKIESSKQVFDKAPSRARRIVKQGDILMSTVRPNLQGFSLIRNRVNNLIASTGFAVITTRKCSNEYLFQYLFSDEIQRQFYQLIVGSNYPAINSSDVKKLKIPIPALPEQQKIASILSTWDDAITKQKSLVEQTEKRNQGLAQQLLTGKKRLNGFDEKWKPQKIKDFAFEQSIKNKENKDYIVLSCTKHNGLVPSLEYFGRQIFSENLETYKIVEKGSFAYATNHIEEGSIGYQKTFDNALISPMYTVFKTDNTIVDEFLFRLLKSHTYIHEYQKRMEGSIDRRGGLRWSEFAKIKVEVPELNEQNAINEFLEMGNKELCLLEQQLASLQNEKKGLMQKLLTGEVRVKIN